MKPQRGWLKLVLFRGGLVAVVVALALCVGCGVFKHEVISPPVNKAESQRIEGGGGHDKTKTETWQIDTPAPPQVEKWELELPAAPLQPEPPKSVEHSRAWWEAAFNWLADNLLPGTACYADAIPPRPTNLPPGYVTVFLGGEWKVVPEGSKLNGTIIQNDVTRVPPSDTRKGETRGTGYEGSGGATPPEKFDTGVPPKVDLGTSEGGKNDQPSTGTGTGGSYKGQALEVGGITALYFIGGILMLAGVALIVWHPGGSYMTGGLVAGAGLVTVILGWWIPQNGPIVVLAIVGALVGLWFYHTYVQQKTANAAADKAEAKFGDAVASNQRGLNAIPGAVTDAVNAAVAATPDGQSVAPESAIKAAIDKVAHTVLGKISEQMSRETKKAVTETKTVNGIDLVIPGTTPKS